MYIDDDGKESKTLRLFEGNQMQKSQTSWGWDCILKNWRKISSSSFICIVDVGTLPYYLYSIDAK